jgi:hypothetical protein
MASSTDHLTAFLLVAATVRILRASASSNGTTSVRFSVGAATSVATSRGIRPRCMAIFKDREITRCCCSCIAERAA